MNDFFKAIVKAISFLFGGNQTKDEPNQPSPPPVPDIEIPELPTDVPTDNTPLPVPDVPITIIEGDTTEVVLPEDASAQDGAETTNGEEVVIIDEDNLQEIEPTDENVIETPSAPTTGELPNINPEGVHVPRFLWCIDNGHGKDTRGKRSPVFDGEQFFEYEFNRDVAVRIMRKLAVIGVQYYDIMPNVEQAGNDLQARVNRANRKRSSLPKIYLSIHSNAGPTLSANDWVLPHISGIETWHYHNSKKGKYLAAVFQRQLVKATGWKNRHIKSRKKNQFFVLKKTAMPAILTENGFYNNKAQVLELMKPAIREKIALAHVAAILEMEEKGFPN